MRNFIKKGMETVKLNQSCFDCRMKRTVLFIMFSLQLFTVVFLPFCLHVTSIPETAYLNVENGTQGDIWNGQSRYGVLLLEHPKIAFSHNALFFDITLPIRPFCHAVAKMGFGFPVQNLKKYIQPNEVERLQIGIDILESRWNEVHKRCIHLKHYEMSSPAPPRPRRRADIIGEPPILLSPFERDGVNRKIKTIYELTQRLTLFTRFNIEQLDKYNTTDPLDQLRIHDMVRTAIAAMEFSVSTISSWLDRLEQIHVTARVGFLHRALLNPTQLKHILIDVESKIPLGVSLKIPTEEIYRYYHTADMVTIKPEKEGLFFRVKIPLTSMHEGSMRLFEVQTMPATNETTHEPFQIELPRRFFALSEDGDIYAELTNEQAQKCLSGMDCHTYSGFHNWHANPSCGIAIYKNDTALINAYCHKRNLTTHIQTTAVFPLAPYKWMIHNDGSFIYTKYDCVITAHMNGWSIRIPHGFTFIHLPRGCRLKDDFMLYIPDTLTYRRDVSAYIDGLKWIARPLP